MARKGKARADGHKTRSWWPLTVVLVALFVGSSAWDVWYPRVSSHDGWLALVGKSDDVRQGLQVRLAVTYDAEMKTASYDVSACGGGEAHFLLFVGGSAQLVDSATWPATSVLTTVDATSVQIEGLGSAELENVQQVPVNFVDMSPCLEEGWAGVVGVSIVGRPRQAFSNASGPMPWVRETYSFPTLGQFPGLDPSLAGSFRFSHLEGDFTRPIPLELAVQAGAVPLNQTVESSRPLLADHSLLEWASSTPFKAEAILRRESLAAFAAGLSAISGVLLGVVLGWQLSRRTGGVEGIGERASLPAAAYSDFGVSPRARKFRGFLLATALIVCAKVFRGR